MQEVYLIRRIITVIQIVKAKQKHVPEIVEIWKEFMDFHKEKDSFFTLRENAHKNFEKHLKKSMTSKKSQVLIALDNKNVVAYSLSFISKYPPVLTRKTFGFISDVAVKKEYRKKGIGKRLLNEIKKWFSQKGITRIELGVSSKNKVAYSFWKKQGFKNFLRRMFLDI